MALASIPTVAADEGAPDCEEDQPEFVGAHPDVRTCEGEHWDGQDTVGAFGCNGQDAGALDGMRFGYGFSLNSCQDPAQSPIGVTSAVGLRASVAGDHQHNDNLRVFVALQLWSVGNTAVDGDVCQKATGDVNTGVGSSDGRCSSGNSVGAATLAWYGEDHMPLNPLATAVNLLDVTNAEVDDGDCTYEEYEAGTCWRDNTAVTVILLA